MEIKFLLRFTKSEWTNAFLDGHIYFNPAYKYCISEDYSKGQFDPYDSHVNFIAQHICFAPLNETKVSGSNYGKGVLLSEKSNAHFQDHRVKNIPVSCYRIVEPSEVEQGVLKLDSSSNFRLYEEFPDYDAFVLIGFPSRFIQQIRRIHPVFANQIYYGYSNDIISGLDLCENDTKISKEFCLQMFSKTSYYDYQKEYRIILPCENWNEGRSIDVGSIKEIAFAANINQLKTGLKIEECVEDRLTHYKFIAM